MIKVVDVTVDQPVRIVPPGDDVKRSSAFGTVADAPTPTIESAPMTIIEQADNFIDISIISIVFLRSPSRSSRSGVRISYYRILGVSRFY